MTRSPGGVESSEVRPHWQLAELARDIGQDLLPDLAGREHPREASVTPLEDDTDKVREILGRRGPDVLPTLDGAPDRRAGNGQLAQHVPVLRPRSRAAE